MDTSRSRPHSPIPPAAVPHDSSRSQDSQHTAGMPVALSDPTHSALDQPNYDSDFIARFNQSKVAAFPAAFSTDNQFFPTNQASSGNLDGYTHPAHFNNGTLGQDQETGLTDSEGLDHQALLFGGNAVSLNQMALALAHQHNSSTSNTLDPSNLTLGPPTAAAIHGQYSHTPAQQLQSLSTVSMHSQSPNSQHSPSPQTHQQNAFAGPRNASGSLDPSSAAYPQGMSLDWTSSNAFQGHRRKTSDAYSDVSSHSNHNSPYLGSNGFDMHSAHVSPILDPQNDQQLFDNDLNFHHINIDDGLTPPDYISPNRSLSNASLISNDQQPLPMFTAEDDFGMRTMDTGFQRDALDQLNGFLHQNNIYNQHAFPTLDNSLSTEGQVDTISPPEFKIDFAPPSRQPSFGPRQRASSGNCNELQPPEALRRKRAKSDPHSSASRSPSPAIANRGRSPSLQPNNSESGGSLSPAAIQPAMRSSSPAGRSRSPSSASSDSRQYLLDLADPDRAASAGVDGKRQKHPATFLCHLCDKRFTRAYNLRSHLRTHTDERPFVCTVCGKAFARQHDRKRHEGLHSGEKKFVCHGSLKTGLVWGCKRRFARADALGRHFRSEAGRECIKPLLDEEAEERRKTWLEEQVEQQMQSQQGFVAPKPMTEQPQQMPTQQFPAALLQMYPDLASFNFGAPFDDAVSGGGGDGSNNVEVEEDYATRHSSFDATSSGIEYDMSDNDMSDFDVAMPIHQPLPEGQQQLQQQQQQQQQLQQQQRPNHQGQSYGVS